MTAQGKSYPMARNDLNDSEFAGPAFSADGTMLFANIQSPGLRLRHHRTLGPPQQRPKLSNGLSPIRV